MILEQEQIDRFWSKVDIRSEDECWPWLAGAKNKEGYGGFYLKQINNTINCHKISFMLAHNFDLEDIPKGIVIRHSCNNEVCINPKHLKMGTYKDNSQDMVAAGNSLVGIKNPRSSLTQKQVDSIREKWDTKKYSQYQLAEEFNVKQHTIQRIVTNKGYRDDKYIPSTINHSCKLTDSQVEEIRKLREKGESTQKIVKMFNIGTSQFYNIIHNRHRIMK